MCKLFRGPPFTLLVVPYNSVYYNYITIIQWLVGWFGDQGKKGVCVGKKVGRGQGGIDVFLKVVIFPSQKYAIPQTQLVRFV